MTDNTPTYMDIESASQDIGREIAMLQKEIDRLTAQRGRLRRFQRMLELCQYALYPDYGTTTDNPIEAKDD